MNKEILKRNASIEEDTVVIVEETKTTLTIQQIERQLMDIQSAKQRIREQNKRLVAEYDELDLQETEIKSLIDQITTSDEIQEI